MYMFFDRLRPDDDIVQVYVADLSDEVSECREHALLVSCRCVPTAHRHHSPLIEAERRCDCREIYVIGMNSHLEERIGHVNLSPDLSLCTVC